MTAWPWNEVKHLNVRFFATLRMTGAVVVLGYGRCTCHVPPSHSSQIRTMDDWQALRTRCTANAACAQSSVLSGNGDRIGEGEQDAVA